MEFTQIGNLSTGSYGLNIRLRIVQKVRDQEVQLKNGGQNRVATFLVADSTDQALLTLWGSDIDKMLVDHNVVIMGAYTTEYNGNLQINISKSGKWEFLKEPIEELDPSILKVQKIQPKYIKICDIPAKQKGINLTKVKVVEIADIREVKVKSNNSTHTVAEAIIADETACVYWTLWDNDIERLKKGDIVTITNAYAKEFRKILKLNTGKYGEFVILPKEDIRVNINKNVSILS